MWSRAREPRVALGLVREAGVRQFLNIGTGLPSANNTHEVAQRFLPESRIVYIENDHSKPGCAHGLNQSGGSERVRRPT